MSEKETPKEVRKWSWGAFFLTWIWGIFNGVWISLLALIPVVNIVMAFVLGFKGREWAWKSKNWSSIEQFNKVQRIWSISGTVLFFVSIALGIIIPQYNQYKNNLKNENDRKTVNTETIGNNYNKGRTINSGGNIVGNYSASVDGGEADLQIKKEVQGNVLGNLSVSTNGCAGSINFEGIYDKSKGIINVSSLKHGGYRCHMQFKVVANGIQEVSENPEMSCMYYHGSQCGFGFYQKTILQRTSGSQSTKNNEEKVLVIPADKIISYYKENAVSFYNKYNGKIVAVHGRIGSIKPGHYGNVKMVIGGSNNLYSRILCDIPKNYSYQVEKLSVNDDVTAIGKIERRHGIYFYNIKMDDCKILG